MSKFRPPEERRTTLDDAFNAVRLQWAVAEASRCLMCDDPPCRKGCLADVDIKKFIRALKSRNMRSALNVIREANFLVATCGRVCPQAELCEGRCSSTDLSRPIAIGELQRFVGEAALQKKMGPRFPEVTSSGRVAVVGGGPAGLSAAYYLRTRGIKVDLYERHDFLGGVMMYGIPSYRLPKALLTAEIDSIAEDGATLVREQVDDFAALAERYDAMVLGCGLGPARTLALPGADLPGVMQADDLLLRVNVRGEKPKMTGNTLVLGGGNTAMDAAGVAVRLGSEVTIVYRRGEAEMPSWLADRQLVSEEGVKMAFMLAPVELCAEDGRLQAVRFQKTELGEPDASGRRRPVPIPGAFEQVACNQVVLALGNGTNNECVQQLGLERVDGVLRVDANTMESSRSGIFVTGDLLSGGGTVVRAVADGKRAASAIAARLI